MSPKRFTEEQNSGALKESEVACPHWDQEALNGQSCLLSVSSTACSVLMLSTPSSLVDPSATACPFCKESDFVRSLI